MTAVGMLAAAAMALALLSAQQAAAQAPGPLPGPPGTAPAPRPLLAALAGLLSPAPAPSPAVLPPPVPAPMPAAPSPAPALAPTPTLAQQFPGLCECSHHPDIGIFKASTCCCEGILPDAISLLAVPVSATVVLGGAKKMKAQVLHACARSVPCQCHCSAGRS
jgi:hypothetical protein